LRSSLFELDMELY